MKEKYKLFLSYLKKFWHYLWYDDSLGSYVVNFAVAFIFIKFIFFPAIGFALNNDYPIVAIVSGSMEHKIVDHRICSNYVVDVSKKNLDRDEWWSFCSNYYISNYNLTKENFETFDYRNGLNIGDVMVLYGSKPENIEVGDVLVFVPQSKAFFEQKGPVIHRVVKKWQDENGKYHFATKGDHNAESFNNFENDITEENVIGVGVLKIPFIGYVKLALNNVLVGIGNIIR